MAGSKLDNCFIDELTNYDYEIKSEDGEYIASAKSLSVLDNSFIQKNAFSLARNDDGSIFMDSKNMPVYDINVHLWMLHTIQRALTKWRWQRDITIDNIALLPEDVRTLIFKEIRTHEGFFESNKEAIEKN